MRAAIATLALLVAAPTLAATEAAGSLDGVTIIDRLDVNDIAAGSVQRFWFRAGMSPVGQPWLVPVVVIKGAQPGPRLLLTAGIHGDELNGIAVLHRLLAGLPVTGADIRRMGVGGLLMEIVSRGQPRTGESPTPDE